MMTARVMATSVTTYVRPCVPGFRLYVVVFLEQGEWVLSDYDSVNIVGTELGYSICFQPTYIFPIAYDAYAEASLNAKCMNWYPVRSSILIKNEYESLDVCDILVKYSDREVKSTSEAVLLDRSMYDLNVHNLSQIDRYSVIAYLVRGGCVVFMVEESYYVQIIDNDKEEVFRSMRGLVHK
jgi:hypothetical protein